MPESDLLETKKRDQVHQNLYFATSRWAIVRTEINQETLWSESFDVSEAVIGHFLMCSRSMCSFVWFDYYQNNFIVLFSQNNQSAFPMKS